MRVFAAITLMLLVVITGARAQPGCTPTQGNFFNVRFTSSTIAADLLADVGADVIVSVRLITIDYNLGKASLKVTRVNGDIRELPIAEGSSITVSGSIIELQSSVHGPGGSGAIAGCIKVN